MGLLRHRTGTGRKIFIPKNSPRRQFVDFTGLCKIFLTYFSHLILLFLIVYGLSLCELFAGLGK